jgi:hypothetical protein
MAVRFEVFTAMTMKNTVFGDVAPCRYFVYRSWLIARGLLLP